MNDQKSIKALQEKAKDMYTYPPIANQDDFSEFMVVTLYDLIPHLDEDGLKKLIDRLEVVLKYR